MIDVQRVQVLRPIGEHHTVAATAEALGVTPSAVSQQLAALAKETEVPLVERSNRRFVLTGAGRVLLERAQVIFAELERAQADLARYAEGSLGSVRVGAFATGISNLVAPAVARLRHTHPRWDFSVIQAEPEHSTELLCTGEIDIAVTMSSPHLPATGSPGFQFHPVMVEPLDVVLPYEHPLATKMELDLATDLNDADWIMSAPGTVWFDTVAAACHQPGFHPRSTHIVTHFGPAFALVAAGLGVALVRRRAWHGMEIAHMVVRPVRNGPRRHVLAVTRSGANPEPLLTAMREAAHRITVPAGRFVLSA